MKDPNKNKSSAMALILVLTVFGAIISGTISSWNVPTMVIVAGFTFAGGMFAALWAMSGN